KARGFVVRPVQTLTVLSTLAPKDADAPLARQKVGPGGFDAVVNGGFYFDSKGVTYAAGPVVRAGVLEATGVPKSAHRGAIAIRDDGTILIGRQRGATLAALEARFGPLRALMGGGALLIEDGVKVSSADLARAASEGGQQFDQGAGGLNAQQMRRTFHTVLAIRDGQLYVVGAVDKTGAEIRDQLFAAGFDSAVKFDGGSGGYFREAGATRSAGRAPLGFGIIYR
ncbi:phosphodiester glycosidase family protein, partial [Myxococcota bacterium]|nr:phosphodiester glycosidase family protein [Myxococcota bacterium]